MFTTILKGLNRPPLQLIRDVETRWSSVYLMIRRAFDLREVCFFVCINSNTEFELGNNFLRRMSGKIH